MDTLEQQARIFTRYLIHQDTTPHSIQLYKIAVGDAKPSKTDKKLLDFMLNHPSSIGFIDSGLVFQDASSEARRRLYVMLAILEASTEYYDSFLPKDRGPFYILFIFYAGTRAVLKTALGLMLVKAVS